jgi:hypothetical protein
MDYLLVVLYEDCPIVCACKAGAAMFRDGDALWVAGIYSRGVGNT